MSKPTSETASAKAGDRSRSGLPLAVDLDGTLLLTDTLFEAIADRMHTRPLWTLLQLAALPFAIAKVKARLQRGADLDIETLPVNAEVLAYCAEAKAAGRTVILASAADQSTVEAVADRFGLFDRAIGSDGVINNKSGAKARRLSENYPDGFEYIGDSPADRKVWAAAKAASIVGAGSSRRKAVEKSGVAIARIFERQGGRIGDWRKAMRLHQWAKNALIFVAPILSMQITDPQTLFICLIAFPLIGIITSATYIINDLLGLKADRRHHSKNRRPFAAGRIKLWQGFVAAPLMILGGLVGAFLLSPPFAGTLLIYLALTLTYSLAPRRVPLLDTMLLGLLYTLRLIIGGVLSGVEVTQ